MKEIVTLLDSSNAAIVMRQNLKPVEGDNAVIFPPTFADVGYNIDELTDADGRVTGNVCLIDSVGSQANRMEPLFKCAPYSQLIPQVQVTIPRTGEIVDILDAGHRVADAVVRFSELSEAIQDAFLAAKHGDTTLLARLAPTSLIFGCWDSRGTGVKLPRIVRATVRAHNVHKLTRSAQFTPALDDYEAAFDKLTDAEKKKLPDAGMGHVPAPAALGGVLIDGQSVLFREAVLSLAALRQLSGTDDTATATLRQYILGLALVTFTAPQDTFLRMGCELTADPERPATWELVHHDGSREGFTLTHQQALDFARQSADTFGVEALRSVEFDAKAAKEALKKAKKEE